MGRPKEEDRGMVSTELIKTLMRYLWKRDSESATCLITELMFTLDDHDIGHLRDMFIALDELNQRPLQQ